jgi:cob(I)alamin adenosyltransferase
MKIYTKTGDHQTTSIISRRLPKDHIILECLGTIDELQASLMVAANSIKKSDIKEIVIAVVQDLFDLSKNVIKYEESITALHVKKVEDWIDHYEELLPPLHEFILPGNTFESSLLHLSRTITRRLERRLITLGKTEGVSDVIFQYVNRISDLLFILARSAEL